VAGGTLPDDEQAYQSLPRLTDGSWS